MKRILSFLAVLTLALFLLPGTALSTNFLNHWYINLDGDDATAPVHIMEYLDIMGPAYVVNDVEAGTFEEWGAFVSRAYDGGTAFSGDYAGYELTGLFSAQGTFELDGSVDFTSGWLEIYVNDTQQFATSGTGGIYGADVGTLIGEFDMVWGEGFIDALGIPNGLFTTQFEATWLAEGYWFDQNMFDLSQLDPISWFLGYGTTNASWVANPSQLVIDDIVTLFAGQFDTYTNTPPFDLVISSNGQFRAEVIPEPTTWLLFGTGLLGLAALGRRKMQKK